MGTKLLLPCFVALLSCAFCHAGSAGKEFATVFMQNFLENCKYTTTSFQIQISALHANTNVKVSVPQLGFNQERTLEAGKITTIQIPSNVEMYGSQKSCKTVQIVATHEVVVASINYKLYTADTSLVYPVSEWGTEYYIFTPSISAKGAFKEFSVTNHKQRNKVQIYPLVPVTFQRNVYNPGSTINVELQPYESLQIQSNYDLTSTRVVSTLPVAVSSGHSCIKRFAKCNHVYEQLLPVQNWGKSFLVAPLRFQTRYDSVYVQASQTTRVVIKSGGQVKEVLINKGQAKEVQIQKNNGAIITADQGVQVLYLFNGVRINSGLMYDPFLMTVLPTDHFCSSYILDGHDNFDNKAIFLVHKSDLPGLRFDNGPMPRDVQFTPIGGTKFSWAEVPLKAGSGQHTVAHSTASFGAYSIGVHQRNGYGAPALCATGPPPPTCSSITCSKDEECQMKDGYPTCVKKHPSGTCWAMGDPHYRTFDGRHFNFMGTCTYIISKNCQVNDGLPPFEVLTQNENRGNTRVSYVGLVTVKVYGVTIIVARSENGLVRVDYNLYKLPVVLKQDKLKLYQKGWSVVIETDFGLMVQYDWESKVVVTVSRDFAGKLCGLCGNFNGNPKDDFASPSGSQEPDAVDFARSWKVPGLVADPLCRDDCQGQCDKCEHSRLKDWEGKAFCGLLTRIVDGPFHLCHATIDPHIFKENCLYDMCMGDGLKHFLCRALEAYATACQEAGIKVFDWRKLAHCPAKCPANSHYELCGTACPSTCADPGAPSKCSAHCVDSCTCNDGFVLTGGKCVPAKGCGCSYEGRHIPHGESFWADKGCHKRCTCNPANNKVECKDTKCKAGQQCQVVNGIRDCHPVSYSTCSATGDPHYKTFDGRRYNFQGTCVYQLVGVCSNDPSLEHFEVLVQNDFRGSKVVSYTKLVEIKVYSLRIDISKENAGKVMVNGELTHLPVYLADGKMYIYKCGWNAVLKTNFGLKVSFDWKSAVHVTLPSTYKDAVCGLCGNYNGKWRDDLTEKGGKVVTNPTVFGKSWQVAVIPGCVDGCKGTCPSCDITQKREYETNAFCGLLRDPKGPFRDCHSKVDPSGAFEDCVYDVCLYKGRKDVLCQAITTYTTACQESGAKVYPWRSEKFCPTKCPSNSHYEICSDGCPATCQSLSAPPGCDSLCEEGCACNDGFILSGERCVPFSKCGCIYGEHYYRIGDVFYPNGKCEEECICSQDGEVQCKKFSCGPNEKCEVADGVRKCQPVGLPGVCVASGDPHYTSFDGRHFDFQGTCTYTLAKGCGLEGTHLVPFSVQVQNERWRPARRAKVSVTKLVAVEVYGYTLIMRENTPGVLVNGVLNNLPLNLNDGEVVVYLDGKYCTVKTKFGIIVTYDLVYHVTVTVPGNYRGKTCGLCGNFNDNKKDDFRQPDGRLVWSVKVFGAKWKVAIPGVVCEDGCSGNTCPKCDRKQTAIFKEPGYCGILTNPKGPFSACHAKLPPTPYFKDCIFDICESNGDRKVLCDSAAAYALNCHIAGVDVTNWRSPSFCPLSCPSNSHYETCVTSCANSCPGLSDIAGCPTTCAEGCECDAGFLFNGESCIPDEQCGCYDNGHSYKPGEVVYFDDCKQKCTCDAAVGLSCQPHTCPSGTKCLVRKEVKACFSPDPCKDMKCREKETCRVEKGEATCVPQYTGTCWAWGDPHYHTFDGLNYDFQGTCKYTISKTCGDVAGLVPFSIEERNDNRGSTAVSFVREVDVSVYAFTFTMIKFQYGRIMVDGETQNLPLVIGENLVTVKQVGGTVVLQTNFGLHVTYDWNSKLVIQLPSSYYGSVCGLCGNFNGNDKDEMLNPARQPVNSVVSWGKSWRVPDPQDPNCWDSCKAGCPTCDDVLQKLYETEAYCGALTNKVDGVFRKCHNKVDPKPFMENCVYDVCLHKGDRKMLCQALASYSEMCLQKGIVVKDWRTKFGCPMSCQPNSHYEACASPCPLTCPSTEQDSKVCKGVCSEGCVCDKGFALSAGKCVPAKQCGCSYQGRYYEPGQSFWGDAGCHVHCVCDHTLHMVVCRPGGCKDTERCAVEDGVRACRPLSYSTCTAAGDPHYLTFDQHRFNFQGTCIYQLVALRSKDPSLTPFEVTVQNDHRGSKAVSYTKVVTVKVYGITITISKDYRFKIMVEDQFASMPFEYEDKLLVFRSGWTAVVETAFGMRVTFDWNSVVAVTLPNTYQGAVCGLCGNYNGNPRDDRALRNGQTAESESKLGESWQVGVVPGCVSGCTESWCKACAGSQVDAYRAHRYCGIIADKAGPFSACHAPVDPAPYLEDCAYDACHYKGHHTAICEAIAAYVSACQQEGMVIRSWRSDSFCPASCPKNSHYELCSSGCPATCASSPAGARCRLPCREGCQCDEGHLLSGDACVPVAECGCSYGGHYYKKGEVFYPHDKCQEQCKCGENGAITCRKFKCGPGEACKVVGGVGGCHPVGEGKCVASGDPHYISFDKQRFDFQGTCVYTLAKVCNTDGKGLVPFAVEESNEKYGNGKVAVTKAVAVVVYGFVITVEQGMKWSVIVDDEVLNLPLSLDEGRITVNQEGQNIIVGTDFGLRVLYDTVYYVEVVVPSTYKGKMCGLCGNYNGKSGDDFLLPNGKQTRNMDDFGKAWTVDPLGLNCGGCGGQYPACKGAEEAKYRQPNSCGIISNTKGPLRACHRKVDPKPYLQNCVFDVCALDGDQGTLCKSVQAYAIACQHAGVQIQPWRTASFCPASCPPNSHYEVCADTCGTTCASLAGPGTCSSTCFEGCECDPRFVSDGDKCVSMNICGCLLEGRYIKTGKSVVSKGCDSVCTCHASGAVLCKRHKCGSGEMCGIRDGVRGCHPKEGICSIKAGGQFSSFDSMVGVADQLGAFEMAALCDKKSAQWFRVVADVRLCEKGCRSAVDTVYVFFADTVIAVNSQREVWANGRKVSLPSTPVKDLSVRVTNKAVLVERWSSVRVSFSFTQEVKVTISAHLASKVCGACGNYNSNAKDDMTTAGGKATISVSKVIGSWHAGDFSGCGL